MKAAKDGDMIKFGEENAAAEISFTSRGREFDGKILFDRTKRKRIFINDIPVRKNSELVGNLNVVFFGPEYLSLIREGPKRRRKNLDVLICQLKPAYLTAISDYKRLNEQKSSLLKGDSRDKMLLSVIDEKLLELSVYISKVRFEYIKKVEAIARKIQLEVSEGKEKLEMRYISNGIHISEENIENLSVLSEKRMVELREREQRYRECIFGPHRDDIEFFINGADLKLFGSQGQQKTAVLVQKIAEVELFFEETGEYPVLLLDDIMSELDSKRQDFVLNKINKGQIFVTCTDSERFKDLAAGKFLNIEKEGLAECICI
jgi:DNA replication and repair protein RecF